MQPATATHPFYLPTVLLISAKGNASNGLNNFSNLVLQLWGHSPLYNQGQIDGNILTYSLNSPHALETLRGEGDRALIQSLLNADVASDGVVNGDSLENAMVDVLDNIYRGGPQATAQQTANDAFAEAALRAQGLLPPPKPGMGEIDPIQLHRPTGSGGSCPFFQQPEVAPQPYAQGGNNPANNANNGNGGGYQTPVYTPAAMPGPVYGNNPAGGYQPPADKPQDKPEPKEPEAVKPKITY